MFLHYFKKKDNKDKEISNKIYLNIIETNRFLINNYKHLLKNDFNSSFEFSTLFLFIFFYGLKNIKKYKQINQELMAIFIRDIDYSLRNNGISDILIGKHVKAYVKKFYFKIDRLKIIFEESDQDNFRLYLLSINIIKNEESRGFEKFSTIFFACINDSSLNIKNKNIENVNFIDYFI
jgi:hypothetical protein